MPDDDMSPVRAIFTGEFHYSSRTRNAGWSAYPAAEPQIFPREFINAAIAAGRAEAVPRSRRAVTAPETTTEA